MKQIKHAALALAMVGMLSAQAHASEAQVQNLQAVQPVAAFSQTDINAMFEQTEQPMQLATLSQQEMKETEGAWVWWAAAGALGGTMNTIGYIGSNPDWSYGGAAYSFLSGASGGLIAALPGGNVARLGYGALGAYTASQPWGGYSWSQW